MTEATRTIVLWCPDWPVVAAGFAPDEPAAVLHANRVVACSAAAGDFGIRRGLRRREAQARCPDIVLLPADAHRDACAFEPVAAAVEEVAPRVEIIRPGTLAIPARGPSRYFGGDTAAAERIRTTAVVALTGRSPVMVGVADGLVAALLAARVPPAGRVVEVGGSAAFLADHPVSALDHVLPDAPVLALVGLFHRLGLRTLGSVAAIPTSVLVGRFGQLGADASRIARGLDERPHLPRRIDPELSVAVEIDPPAQQVETAAFLARTLSTELSDRLASRGLMCMRVAVEVETEHGETLSRLWRHEGGLGPAAIADRVRWQLDGWLRANDPRARPTGGIVLLRLAPDQVVADKGRQLGFWGGIAEADERAARGVARLQGLLGPDAVCVVEARGGRGLGDRIGLVPAHGVRLGAAQATADADRPWPERLPTPSPAIVHASPLGASVIDSDGRPVGITAGGLATAEPATVAVGPGPPVEVTAWCGPWPYEERWWDPMRQRRRVGAQVTLADGSAHLLSFEAGQWSVEGTYD